LLAGLSVVSLAARRSEFVEALELKTLDWRFRRMPGGRVADPGIVMLALDTPSLENAEKDAVYWPWPRGVYAAVIKFCRAGGARGWPGDSPRIRLDCRRLRALGWRPTAGIREMILETLAWLQAEEERE
jgi:hypothetical protein